MGRAARVLLAAGVILLMTAGPALAQQDRQPVIDLTKYITVDSVAQWADRNGDHIPDIPLAGPEGDIPAGIAGIWDDAIGALTADEFLLRVDPEGTGFNLNQEGAYLLGPCGGSAISYDAKGDSLDAMIDLGDGSPPVDIYGEPAMTAGNPFQVDSGGTVLYFGFTLPDPGLSGVGDAFHNHRWEMVVMGISADDGGDPNPRDKNRNAGVMELGDLLPFEFQAKVQGSGRVRGRLGQRRAARVHRRRRRRRVCRPHDLLRRGLGGVRRRHTPCITGAGAVATALALAGFSGILFNARPALSWRA